MSFWTLILRSLRFHARSHAGALLGAAVGSAVLIGALVVGDSVRESLRRLALLRLGNIDLALVSNDRFFQDALAPKLESSLKASNAAVLLLPATANRPDGSARANQVQLLGVDEAFWSLSGSDSSLIRLAPDEVILNERLARQLQATPGDVLLLRAEKPSRLSRDAPISPQEDTSVAMRVTVRAVAPAEALGLFGLRANQIPPFNAYVSRAWLQEKLELPGGANLLLADIQGEPPSRASAISAIQRHWTLADAQLELREIPGGSGLELRTSRVFLDPPIVQAAERAAPQAQGVLTYLVNDLKAGARSTPYSMVTAIGPPIVPADMRDDEILINQWLADDLQAAPGNELTLTYFSVGLGRTLEERQKTFRVRAILPLAGPAADRSLMPDFPGFVEAQSCRDWDAGFAIDLNRLRSQDQSYWDEYRGTPKAFVSLPAGKEMWANRFGMLTAVRFPLPAGAATNLSELRRTVEARLLSELDPASIGLQFEPVREQALAASAQGQDFGQLFLGVSFFLIVAALLLMALLFQLSVERRANEVGTLLALGYTPGQVRRLLLGEGSVLALLGGLAGMAGGLGYAQAMLYGLSTIWRSAVGAADLRYYASGTTLVIGILASAIVAVLTIWLALRKQVHQPARELLAEGAGLEALNFDSQSGAARWSLGIGVGSGLAAVGLVAFAILKNASAAGVFFGAGALLLVSGLSLTAAFLKSLAQSRRPGTSAPAADLPTLTSLSVRNCARRAKRSLATAALLACGSFLIVSIGAFRLDANLDAGRRSSGTGGFAFIGESTRPIVQDLNRPEGLEFVGLDTNQLAGVSVVAMRVRDGDDASCLNLNRAQKPRLLGVPAEALARREAFTFVTVAEGLPVENPWRLLDQWNGADAIPAIGDQASIQWALGKKVGDTLEYTDERGQSFQIRIVASIANSILQGSLLIAEAAFIDRFPTAETGYRMFLIDAPSNRQDAVSSALSRALQDQGLELIPAVQRLAEYNAVQNTYLQTFQVLGGLGLLLGSLGLGVVVLRNVLERRSELGAMAAMGFRSGALKWMILSEHGALLLLGLGTGLAAALVAVLPLMRSPGTELPYAYLLGTLAAVFLSGALWTWLASVWALRGQLLDALRHN